MYPEKIQSLLEEKDISKGDKVKLNKEGETYEGILMPRSKAGDNRCIVIKLDNGYNIGIRHEKVEIEKIEDRKFSKTEEEHEEVEEADIAILHTGGTIASKVSYSAGGVVTKFSPQEIMDMYPELEEIADFRSELVSQMWSEDMEFAHYQKIADSVEKEIEKGVEGIIISHGTDTMHYSSAALSLMLQNLPIPVILVGSQRSSDRPSSDAAMNLISAAEFITNSDFEGVGVCMHESSSDNTCLVHPPCKVRKMHTSRRDAFRTLGDKPIARVNYPEGEIEFLKDIKDESGELEKYKELDGKVALVKVHPNMDMDIVSHYAEKGYRGIVLEGTGLGHAPINSIEGSEKDHEKLLEGIKEFTEEGGIVAMSSQCLNGRVNMNVYDTGRKLKEAGAVSAENMTPETAFIKLAWSLGNSSSREEAIDMFKTNYQGEITEREGYEDFGRN